jgi:membrane protein implicated in regulation of membrane protease activity
MNIAFGVPGRTVDATWDDEMSIWGVVFNIVGVILILMVFGFAASLFLEYPVAIVVAVALIVLALMIWRIRRRSGA